MMHYYTLVTGASTDTKDFTDRVQELLSQGWTCQGGISFGAEGTDNYGESCWVMVQALGRSDFKKPPSKDTDAAVQDAQ